MKTLLIYISTIGIFLFSFAGDAAAQSGLSFSGYVKGVQTVSFEDIKDSIITSNLINNRLNFRWDVSEGMTSALEVRNRLFYGEQVKYTPGFGRFLDEDMGLVDLSANIVDENNLVLNTSVDRLWINWANDDWDVRAGRQRINWGLNLTWNPNDIFNAYNFLDFDYEERPGSDAIRVQYYMGLFSNFDIAYKPGKGKDDDVGALRFFFNDWGYDFQFFGGIYLDDITAGTGWAGSISDAGFKGEFSYFHPYNGNEDESDEVSASLSVDYSFPNGIYLNGSILFNSLGSNSFSGVQNFLDSELSPKLLMPAKYSLLLQGSNSFSPIFNGSLSVIFSPVVNLAIIYPQFGYSIAEDWDLDFIAELFWAEKNDSFQSIGNYIFTRLRWSF